MNRLKVGSLSLDVAPDWTVSTVVLVGPPPKPASGEDAIDEQSSLATDTRLFQSNLVATMEKVDPTVTSESYVRRQLEGLRKAQVLRRESRSPEKVTLSNGDPGLITEQIVASPDGALVRQLQLVTIKDGVAYTVIASALDGSGYKDEEAVFRKMLLSFG